jgi:hypothetical protein
VSQGVSAKVRATILTFSKLLIRNVLQSSAGVRTKYDRIFERKNDSSLSPSRLTGGCSLSDYEDFIALKPADHNLDELRKSSLQ